MLYITANLLINIGPGGLTMRDEKVRTKEVSAP